MKSTPTSADASWQMRAWRAFCDISSPGIIGTASLYNAMIAKNAVTAKAAVSMNAAKRAPSLSSATSLPSPASASRKASTTRGQDSSVHREPHSSGAPELSKPSGISSGAKQNAASPAAKGSRAITLVRSFLLAMDPTSPKSTGAVAANRYFTSLRRAKLTRPASARTRTPRWVSRLCRAGASFSCPPSAFQAASSCG